MNEEFLDSLINIKDIPKEHPVVLSLLENNEKQIAQLGQFLMSDKKMALVSGFVGSGKSEVVDFVLRNLKDDVLILHYTCFETTILDDLLLCFYELFRSFVLRGIVQQPKVKAENFTQMINSYFTSVVNPITIVIDSFEAVVKDNRGGIIDFLNHLATFPRVKIILISTKFQEEDFTEDDCEKVSVLALSQKMFEKYLKDNGIKNIGVFSNELYKISKGYFKNVELAAKVINLRGLSLITFLEKYTKSYMSYSEFIIREMLSLVDPVSAHLFRLLTVMRIPIHMNLLKTLHLYDENKILYFIQNSLLNYEGNCIYLKEAFRNVIENQIPDNVLIKLHSACIDLYNTQLPLKPSERDLLLSRQTMRNEIEYHSMFLPKRPLLQQKTEKVEHQVEKTQNQKAPTPLPLPVKKEPEKIETKKDKIDKISFIIEDEAVLDDIADSINSFMVSNAKSAKVEKEGNSMTLQQLLNAAKIEEKNYNYKQVVMLYQIALSKTSDANFFTFLPSIYIKLAQAYEHLSDLYNALDYYTQAHDFYYNASDYEKVYEMKLAIADVYYSMYKYDNAKFILSELEQVKDLPKLLKIKTNLAIARLSDNPEIEYKYYKQSIPLVELGTDKALLSELYYKYAVSCSEVEDLRSAAQFYLKCIDIDSNPAKNQYLSMALSNLAELYDELGSTKQAIQYYNESISIDQKTKNYNGLYVSASHLAEIYAVSDEAKTMEYYNKALEYAKQLNEPFYIVSTKLEMADFCSLRRNFEMTYKYLIEAYKLAQNTLTKENSTKITSRLEDLKKRITSTDLMRYQAKYGK